MGKGSRIIESFFSEKKGEHIIWQVYRIKTPELCPHCKQLNGHYLWGWASGNPSMLKVDDGSGYCLPYIINEISKSWRTYMFEEDYYIQLIQWIKEHMKEHPEEVLEC